MFEQPRLWLGCRVSLSDDVAVVYDWQEERLRRGDDLRLRMAIEESQREKAKPEEVCACVCVWVREGERARETRSYPRVESVGVCVWVYVNV